MKVHIKRLKEKEELMASS